MRRANGRLVALVERDFLLFVLVGLCAYIALDQIARALFPSVDRARRRVRQLFDAGYLNIAITTSNAPNLVSLTKRAITAVADRSPDLATRLRLPGVLRLAGVEHHLAVVDARLYAAAVGDALGLPLARWSNAGGELGRELGLDAWRLEPDGLAEFAGRDARVVVAFEVDCGNESVGVVASKLARYREASGTGALAALVVSVKAGATRRETIAEAVRRHDLARFAEVVDHATLIARPIARPAWTAGREKRAEGPNSHSAFSPIPTGNRDV